MAVHPLVPHTIRDTAAPAYSALLVLAASLGMTVVICGPDPQRLRRSHLRGTGALLILCSDRSLMTPGDVDLIHEAVDAGRNVVVALGDGGTVDIALALPSGDDPLVLDAHLRVQGRQRLEGLVLEADDLVALDISTSADVQVTAAHAGSIIAASRRCGTGRVEFIGSVDFVNDQWITAADNAAILAELLAGTEGATPEQRTDALAVVAAHRPAAPTPHAEVPAIATASDEWSEFLRCVPEVHPEDPAFVSAAGHARRLLPAQVHAALIDLSDESNSLGALLLTGLPVGELPDTPSRPTDAVHKDRTSEFVLLSLGRSLGQPIGYLPEHGGTIVQNLVPTPGGALLQTSTSSAVELEFHTETAFHPHRPRYLLLLCLRGDEHAQTMLCSVAEIVHQLPLAVRRVLSEPRFRTGVDASFADAAFTDAAVRTGDQLLGRPVPVLAGNPARPTLTFDADLMHGIDDEAIAALAALRELARARRIGVTLRSGDALVVDNHTCIHGRSAFDARYDGTDRWLQRSFVVSDLSASAGSRHGRVVTTRFV